ncbi:MAG: SRPBCC family protein [Flavisolibacter sp.]
MPANLIAKAETTINAPVVVVWDALLNPDMIKKYMFGTTVNSEWKKGSSISWKGEWQGKAYEDKGEILDIAPQKKLSYSHFSPLSGLLDVRENYHTVTIELAQKDQQTYVSLTQDKNETEQAKEHAQKNWEMMLTSMKKLLEEGSNKK